MSSLLLGVAVGLFIAAFINHTYNDSRWVSTKYLVWAGIIVLLISVILGWPDIRKGFKDSTEFGEAIAVYVNS